MTATSNYALRLQKSLLDEVKRIAAECRLRHEDTAKAKTNGASSLVQLGVMPRPDHSRR